MGSPVSVVVAEIVIQNIEEQALATYSETLPLWLRYVEDSDHWCNKIDEFHEHLDKQNTSIQFTKDIEEKVKVPLLYCLVTRENNTLPLPQFQETNTHWQTAWPKRLAILLHTKRRIFTRRAQIVCDSDDSLTDEIKHLNTVFIKSNYSTYFIERITYIWPNDS